LASSQIEEFIVKENFKGTEDYYIKFEEFVQRLKIPADDVSYTLFRMFVNPSEVLVQDVIDFKEYLLHALFLIKMQEPKIELVRVLFMVSWEVDATLQQSESFWIFINSFTVIPVIFSVNPSTESSNISSKFPRRRLISSSIPLTAAEAT
jgi:hypothetical protein